MLFWQWTFQVKMDWTDHLAMVMDRVAGVLQLIRVLRVPKTALIEEPVRKVCKNDRLSMICWTNWTVGEFPFPQK